MKIKMAFLIIVASIFLGACDGGKEDVKREIKYDLSVEYEVPISDVEIEEVEYGVSVFSTNQFKVTVKGKGISFYFIEKGNSGDNFRRVPMNE